jgi:FkbM family methyltransferase
MHNFANTILIVVFNYSNRIYNKDFIKSIYEKHFKTIIFYSDYPIAQDDEINFINIDGGHYVNKIFKHFYNKYNKLIDDSDGIFYTMDDNIVNVNILNLFDNNKILYYPPNNKYLSTSTDFETLAEKSGKNAISNLLNDTTFQKYNIDKFSGSFSDFFYLPKKYLTDELFELFELFSKYEVFFEISIPTIIHNIEHDKTQYQLFTCDILCNANRSYSGTLEDDYNQETSACTTSISSSQKFLNKEYIYHSLNHNHNLFLHPIKFNENPISKEWLKDIFCKEKCVIITTINKPTETIFKHITNPNYDVIIVGDNKTPDDYKNLNCIYLDISAQNRLFPELSAMFPYNHYCRKNLGYLYAIKKGYKIIYETDDDNIPYDNFDNVLQYDNIQMISEKNNKWINIFKYFTNNAYIWPRGYPLSLLKTTPNYLIQDTDKTPSIINGLVENDPDVDALFRIICTHQDSIQWEKNKKILIDNTNVCVFNTQNTFWLNPDLFICLLIPSSVSFRYCDILRGIINNIILKKTNNYMMYSSPNVVQNRNEHNLITDFKSEYEMYIHNENILDFIEDNLEVKFLYIIQTSTKLPDIYECLRKRNVVLLSFKENTPDTTIFYPNSTWTTGRNKLREYVLNLKEKYDYYIFLDEDVLFTDYSQENGFNKLEELIIKYKPYIANPNLDNYYTHHTYGNNIPLGESQTTTWFDGMCNAFSKEAFFSNVLFPYIDIFDNKSWWMSQYIMIILCSIYKKEVVVFNNLKVTNEIHSAYPKEDVFKETEQYVFNNLINVTQLNIINDIKSSSIFKIIDFLNIVLHKFNKINFIDVGCAIGDVRNLIKHNNLFSIGIDPLIEKYKNRCNNTLSSYNILYDVAVDIEEGEKKFNITSSLDTSSLYDFNTELTSDENNKSYFYIPKSNIDFITNIVETKQVRTKTLKNIIEKDLKNDIIHILKVDAQGNDLNVIKSLGNYLNNVMFIVIESNSDNTSTLYKNSTSFSVDYAYLKSCNFELITKEILLRDDYDCLFYNTNLIKNIDLNWDNKNFKEIIVKTENNSNVKSNLLSIYNNLLSNNVITQKDVDILDKWITYF